MEAAARLSAMGFAVSIIEREEKLGGRLNQWHALFPYRNSSEDLRSRLIGQITDKVDLITSAHIINIEKNNDGFAIALENKRVITASAVLLTTGFDIFEAEKKEEYGYGIYENVITSVELEQMFRSGKPIVNAHGKVPERIGFIHCVGSRDEKAGNPHCSKVCCITAVKQAIEVKEILPSAEVYLFYMDLRMFGRHFEELYKEAQFKYGIQFIRARLSEAFEKPDGTLQIRIEDTLLSKPLKMSLDLMVLMVGIQPHKKQDNLIDLLKLEKDTDEFIKLEDHLLPYWTKIPGLFCAGGVTGPKTIEETLAGARSAAVEIAGYLGNIKNYAGQEHHVAEL